MIAEDLIGKTVVNLENEKGLVIGVDGEGRFEVQYEDHTSTYIQDAFERGYLTIDDPLVNQRIKLDKINRGMKKLTAEVNRHLTELNNLIGLDAIKERVQDLVCEIKISKLRDAYDLKYPEVSKHLVFIGNPGTGKTTVARIIGKIYKALGVLSKGQFVEADRSTLVAGYQGQTAIKTKEVIAKAIGGILFIDEAYALVRGRDDDFGYEALDTLTKEIEDHRSNLMVIVAGYKKEMEDFLTANPGLCSRFKTIINFDDYNDKELYLIFKNLLKDNDYILSKEAEKKMKSYFKSHQNMAGNGREVRNHFEEIVRYQSKRLSALDVVSKEMLMTIEVEDLKGFEEQK